MDCIFLVLLGVFLLLLFKWKMVAALLFVGIVVLFYFFITKWTREETKDLRTKNEKLKSDIEDLKKHIDKKNENLRYFDDKTKRDLHTYEKTLWGLEKELHDKEIENERNLDLALTKQREDLLESAKNECSEDYNNARVFFTKIKSKDPFFDKPTREKYLKAFKDARLDRAFASYLTAPDEVTITAKIPSFTEKGKVYTTSLTECSCRDYHNPCKHMIGLALYYNAVYNTPEAKDILEEAVKERDKTRKLKKEIDAKLRKLEKKSK